jgi:hypothetical protein
MFSVLTSKQIVLIVIPCVSFACPQLAAPEALYDAVKTYILKLALPGLPRQLVCYRCCAFRMYCRWGVQFLFLRAYVPETRQVDGFPKRFNFVFNKIAGD